MDWKTLVVTAAAAAFALPFAASADNDKPKSEKAAGSAASGRATGSAALFDRLDRNRDGFVTRDEARDATELQGRFAEMDKDNDGKISRGEMRALDNERRGAAGATK
jgi:hypothetical protein